MKDRHAVPSQNDVYEMNHSRITVSYLWSYCEAIFPWQCNTVKAFEPLNPIQGIQTGRNGCVQYLK